MRINERETSTSARWSLRLALFTAQILIVAVLLHRFASFSTASTINLMVFALIGTALGILLAVLAFLRIWNTGIRGTGMALTALLIGLLVMAVPLYHLPNLIRLPAINDISTDLLAPPEFKRISELREADANTTAHPGTPFITQQARSYPDITPLTLERGRRDSYDLVRDVIADLGWQVVSEAPPDKDGEAGRIEAVDHSLLLGFKDDVVIRITGDEQVSKVDMRSASRYGRHDLGANAHRVRELFGLVKNRIARAEARKLDVLERARIAERVKEERKLRELERSQKQETLVIEPAILPPAQFGQGGAPQLPLDDPELGPLDPAQSSAQTTQPSGFDFVNTVRRSQSAPTRKERLSDQAQKIQASKRRRKDTWIPFDLRP